MSILYLTYDGLTDPLGQSQVLPYVIGLSNKGWEMNIISFEKKDRFKKLSKEIRALCEKNDIEWHPLFYTKNPPVISTLHDIRKMRAIVNRLSKDKEVKIIHCRSYLPILTALPLQKKGIKVLFDMRGFWADERVEVRIWNTKNPLFKGIYKYFKSQEKRFLHQADAIVSLTDAAIPELIKIGAKSKITVIPTSTDLSLFDSSRINKDEQRALKQKLKLTDKYILGYSGSLGTWYLLDEMLLFFKSLKLKKNNVHFLILTKDPEEIILKKAKSAGISQNDFTIIASEREEMPTLYSLFNLAVMFIKPSFSKKASSPTKLGEMMSMGIPVICNANVGDVKEIVNQYNAGIVLEELDVNAFEIALDTLNKGEFYSVEEMKKGANEYYDLSKAINKYDSIYYSLN